MDAGRDVAEAFVRPQWGITGYSGELFGTVSWLENIGTYCSTTTLICEYGVTGYTTGVATRRVFTRCGVLLVFRP